MYEEKDYILRLINEIIRALIKWILGKDMNREEDVILSSEIAELYKELLVMSDEGEITSAEDRLLEYLDLNNLQYLQMALMFYQHLNEKTEAYLTEHNFSKTEVLDGVTDMANVYGYGSIIETFVDSFDR